MTEHQMIHTHDAPDTIGAYSQAMRCGDLVFISGQIGMDPRSGELVSDDISVQLKQIFANMNAICHAAGGRLGDLVKLTVYLTDLSDFEALNTAMTQSFAPPYPARAAVGVRELPKGAKVEIEAIMMCNRDG